MRKLFALLTAVLMLCIFSSCSFFNKGKKMENQYEITVTQSGKELGKIVIKLYADVAPKHTHNFDSLVAAKFYDGTAFHRVIPNFMIQGGDPNSRTGDKSTWGYGDPKQTRVPAEFSTTLSHKRGIISAARSNDPNSAASQFFICVADCTQLDGNYSIFGEVVSGMDVADKIVNSPRDSRDNPLEKIEMKIVKL
jgi:peptidyl-prolyl cis-trans isomerase B (cyclophilin B)